MFRIAFKKSAEKQLRDLPERQRERVFDALEAVSADPFQGKKLHGEWLGHYSVRVWPYRIIYTIDKDVVKVTVVTIAHRKDAYR